MSLTTKTRNELINSAQQLLDLVRTSESLFTTERMLLINAARIMSQAVLEDIKE